MKIEKDIKGQNENLKKKRTISSINQHIEPKIKLMRSIVTSPPIQNAFAFAPQMKNAIANAPHIQDAIVTATPVRTQEDKNQFEDQYEAAKFLNWRLSDCYQELYEIENSLHMVEYDKIPTANNKNQFSEKFMIELDQSVKSAVHLSYFQSKVDHLHKYICKIKVNMIKLGLKFGVKLCQKTLHEAESHF